MRKAISESEIETFDLKPFHEISAMKSADDFRGVEIYSAKRMPPFVSSHSESPPSETNYLVVVVDNPDDPETIERLKKKVLARI
ncbi:hypothetical protein GIV49_24455 [Pseudomonas syringae]|uniref:hypothetical protein n=1 Tax=Pseudomonas syringae TaxID=317 RepID=UPI001F399CFA|nr:hypothetical protein [Pseudomonas syringae]MCF5652683.1 hypothetical protein [Pseudomonas syringae]